MDPNEIYHHPCVRFENPDFVSKSEGKGAPMTTSEIASGHIFGGGGGIQLIFSGSGFERNGLKMRT